MGVNDVGPEPTEKAMELGGGGSVVAESEGAGGVVERVMRDSICSQHDGEGPGGRRRVHLVAGVAKGPELLPEKQFEADVGGRDVE
jgi:hypothetical protein